MRAVRQRRIGLNNTLVILSLGTPPTRRRGFDHVAYQREYTTANQGQEREPISTQ